MRPVYQLRLPPSDGPVDGPLRVIEHDKFALADVSPVACTEQVLAHLTALVAPPPPEVAAFSQVPARLLVLKSRSLLPKPPVAMADDSGDNLIRQFGEHQALSAVLANLADRGQQGGRLFSRRSPAIARIDQAPSCLAGEPPSP